MNEMSVGGLMSGLDTNAVVDSLVKQSRRPLQKYQNQHDLKTLEKSFYQEVNDSLTDLKTDILQLRLESTFNVKKTEISE